MHTHYMRNKKPPKNLSKPELRNLIRELKEIRKVATMEHTEIWTHEPVPFHEDKTEEVKALTEAWRQSWIINPLDELIARYENHLKEISK